MKEFAAMILGMALLVSITGQGKRVKVYVPKPIEVIKYVPSCPDTILLVIKKHRGWNGPKADTTKTVLRCK